MVIIKIDEKNLLLPSISNTPLLGYQVETDLVAWVR